MDIDTANGLLYVAMRNGLVETDGRGYYRLTERGLGKARTLALEFSIQDFEETSVAAYNLVIYGVKPDAQ